VLQENGHKKEFKYLIFALIVSNFSNLFNLNDFLDVQNMPEHKESESPIIELTPEEEDIYWNKYNEAYDD
jgi:hypothetical protein